MIPSGLQLRRCHVRALLQQLQLLLLAPKTESYTAASTTDQPGATGPDKTASGTIAFNSLVVTGVLP